MQDSLTSSYYDENANARRIVLALLSLGCFLSVITLSATLIAVPPIAAELEADAVSSAWIGASFVLANLIAMLPAGRIADIYGRKKIYLMGLVIFLVANLVAGIAPSVEVLLSSRVLQGIGGAMLYGPGMAIASSVFRNHGRGTALGLIISAVYFGLTCGPLLGGWISDQFGWRYIFLMQIPPLLLVLGLSLVYLRGEWRGDGAGGVDWTGSILLAAGFACLFSGFTRLPQPDSFLALLLGLVVFRLLYGHLESSSGPLLRIALLRETPPLRQSLLAAIFLYGANFSTLFVVGLYLQYNLGLSTSRAGMVIMLQALAMAVVAPLAGRMTDRLRPRLLASWGAVLVAAGLLIALVLLRIEVIVGVAVSLTVIGLGFGLFSTPNSTIAIASVDEKDLGITSGLVNLARLIGQMLGIGVTTLLMALFIGPRPITAERFDDLAAVLTWTLLVSVIFAILSVWCSTRARQIKGVSVK